MKLNFFDFISRSFGSSINYNRETSNAFDSADTLRAGDMSGGKCGLISTSITVTGPSSGINSGIAKAAEATPNGKTPNSESGQSLREDDKIRSYFSPSAWRLIEITVAELIGTACLMFFGCMGAPLPPFQGAIVFGLVVCTLIQIFGHISAAHFNPAVTVTAIVLGKITPFTAIAYFAAEFIGALLGISLLKVITPDELWEGKWGGNATGVCTTVPVASLTDVQSLGLEFLATAFLIFTVCSVWDARNADKPDSVPLKFAVTITVISAIVGPLTGASMNPARTLGPSIVNGVWTKHWIYWIGPMSAGFLVSVFYQLMFNQKHQLKPEVAEEVPLTGILAGDSKTGLNLRQSNVAINEKHSHESQGR